MYKRAGKRLVDILLGGTALIGLSPVLALVALAILIEDGSPVIFRQKRVGRCGTTFTLLKFRSMPVNTPNMPSSKARALKVTKVGTLIRRTNLDELPQLINIIRGDMSLVGPRPALPNQEHVNHLRKHSRADLCKPGLTGLAQVNAFTDMTDDEKCEWDQLYSANVSLVNDLGIMIRTVGYLLKPPPIY